MVGGNFLITNRFYELKPFTYSKGAISEIVNFQNDLFNWNKESLFSLPFLSDRFLTEFIYHNHGLEGIKLDYDDINLAIKDVPSNKKLEAQNSMKAHRFVFGDDFKFSLENIVEAHSKLMDGIIQKEDGVVPELGLRDSPIYMGFEFQGFDHDNIEESLDTLIKWCSGRKVHFKKEYSEKEVLNVLHLGINFYFNFERIHPFNDGNGRIGRILLLRLLSETQHFPFYFSERKRSQHMNVFDRSIRNGNRKIFSDFFIKQYRDCLRFYD